MGPRSEELRLVAPHDRAELREWLQRNHAASPGIRLAIGKKGNRVTELTYEDAIQEGLCFGWIDSVAQRLDADRYTIRFTPRKPGGTWARSNKARVERLIAEGCMTPAGMAAIEAAKRDGSWNSINDVEDLVVPEDLAAALAADPSAEKNFHALSDSARKLALHWVVSAKRPETRAKRIAATVTASAEGRRPV